MQVIHFLLAIKKTIVDLWNSNKILLKTIFINWGSEISEVIAAKQYGQECFRQVIFISVLYQNYYTDANNALNYIIVKCIFSNHTR